jgi:hypothetical protein
MEGRQGVDLQSLSGSLDGGNSGEWISPRWRHESDYSAHASALLKVISEPRWRERAPVAWAEYATARTYSQGSTA